MTRIFIVRHAQAMGNHERRFQGHTDGEVSEMGAKQLECLAERFKEYPIQVVYASPLKRAYQTALAVNRYHNVEMILDPRLKEIHGGDFEQNYFDSLGELFPEQYQHWNKTPHLFEAPNGEKMSELYERIITTIDEIAKNNQGKTLAVVSHGCAIRNYLCYASKLPFEQLSQIGWADNTSVSLVEYDDNFIPTLLYSNDNTHLDPEISTFAIQDWWKEVE